jgi:phosphoheptose isomerase
MTYAQQHLAEATEVISRIDVDAIERMAELLRALRERHGRLFFLGVGGSAGNCSHAVNDFRKIVGIEAYAPTDNVSELTARTNDEGWETVFVEWLKTSRLSNNDMLFIFSVGGGNLEKNVSPNLGRAGGRRRRSRRRIHRESRGRVRHCADRESRNRHPALGSVPGGRMAPSGVASFIEGKADEMGVDG